MYVTRDIFLYIWKKNKLGCILLDKLTFSMIKILYCLHCIDFVCYAYVTPLTLYTST